MAKAVQVPPTALAATLTGPYSEPYEFLQQQVSPPGEKEALVSLSFSGVCHGDVYSRDGGGPAPPAPHRPLIGGHEGVGTIVALGANAANSCSFRIGDLVGIAWRTSVCGKCEPCLSGRENHCGEQVITGLHASGTYQREAYSVPHNYITLDNLTTCKEYITFPVDQLIPIPDGIDLPQACCVLCAGVTAFSSLRLMDPQPGTWCVIAGAAGGLGHLAIQYAKCFGLRVLAIDGGGADKEAFCRDMGADTYVDFIKEGVRLVEKVRSATVGGARSVLVLSPHQGSYEYVCWIFFK